VRPLPLGPGVQVEEAVAVNLVRTARQPDQFPEEGAPLRPVLRGGLEELAADRAWTGSRARADRGSAGHHGAWGRVAGVASSVERAPGRPGARRGRGGAGGMTA